MTHSQYDAAAQAKFLLVMRQSQLRPLMTTGIGYYGDTTQLHEWLPYFGFAKSEMSLDMIPTSGNSSDDEVENSRQSLASQTDAGASTSTYGEQQDQDDDTDEEALDFDEPTTAFEGTSDGLDDGCSSDIGAYSDISDGLLYHNVMKQLKMTSSDITLSFNTYGAPVFDSSKSSIWPEQVMINELPALTRWQNVMISGVWFSSAHPPMHLSMKRFVEEINEIGKLVWTNSGNVIQSAVHALVGCEDSPARTQVLNSKQFNGYYGCSWCLEQGATIDGPWPGIRALGDACSFLPRHALQISAHRPTRPPDPARVRKGRILRLENRAQSSDLRRHAQWGRRLSLSVRQGRFWDFSTGTPDYKRLKRISEKGIQAAGFEPGCRLFFPQPRTPWHNSLSPMEPTLQEIILAEGIVGESRNEGVVGKPLSAMTVRHLTAPVRRSNDPPPSAANSSLLDAIVKL
ncbi:hypothetical protein MTO96_033405 [Rhipicephalus appendiculatus]